MSNLCMSFLSALALDINNLFDTYWLHMEPPDLASRAWIISPSQNVPGLRYVPLILTQSCLWAAVIMIILPWDILRNKHEHWEGWHGIWGVWIYALLFSPGIWGGLSGNRIGGLHMLVFIPALLCKHWWFQCERARAGSSAVRNWQIKGGKTSEQEKGERLKDGTTWRRVLEKDFTPLHSLNSLSYF